MPRLVYKATMPRGSEMQGQGEAREAQPVERLGPSVIGQQDARMKCTS